MPNSFSTTFSEIRLINDKSTALGKEFKNRFVINREQLVALIGDNELIEMLCLSKRKFINNEYAKDLHMADIRKMIRTNYDGYILGFVDIILLGMICQQSGSLINISEIGDAFKSKNALWQIYVSKFNNLFKKDMNYRFVNNLFLSYLASGLDFVIDALRYLFAIKQSASSVEQRMTLDAIFENIGIKSLTVYAKLMIKQHPEQSRLMHLIDVHPVTYDLVYLENKHQYGFLNKNVSMVKLLSINSINTDELNTLADANQKDLVALTTRGSDVAMPVVEDKAAESVMPTNDHQSAINGNLSTIDEVTGSQQVPNEVPADISNDVANSMDATPIADATNASVDKNNQSVTVTTNSLKATDASGSNETPVEPPLQTASTIAVTQTELPVTELPVTAGTVADKKEENAGQDMSDIINMLKKEQEQKAVESGSGTSAQLKKPFTGNIKKLNLF